MRRRFRVAVALCLSGPVLWSSAVARAQWVDVGSAAPAAPLAFSDVLSAKTVTGSEAELGAPIAYEPPLPTPRRAFEGQDTGSRGPAKTAPGAAKDAGEPPAIIAGFQALPQQSVTPPDTNGAAGPNHLMTMLNDRVRLQERDGTVILTKSLFSFWSPLGISNVFDPKTVYDPLSERFIAVAMANRRSVNSALLLGVSKTNDPTGGWYLWKFDADPANVNWADYTYVGVSEDKITFSTNLFTVAADSFSRVAVFVVDKSTALDGDPLVSGRIDTATTASLAPCVTHDAGLVTQYLVAVAIGNLNNVGLLQVFRITGDALSAVLQVHTSMAASAPWNLGVVHAPQLGSGFTLATNDDRVMNALFRDGRVWLAHTVFLPAGEVTDVPTRAGSKWWEIDPEMGETMQSGVIEDPTNGFFYYYPTIAVNRSNDVLMAFSGSSSSTYVGAYYVYRNNFTPWGEMSEIGLLKAGEGPYTGLRWGDYSATMVDPLDDESFWTLQEYADVGNRWATWWGRIESTGGLPVDGPVSWWWLVGASILTVGTGLALLKFRVV